MSHPTSSAAAGTRTDRAPYQWLALVIGVVYLLVGLLGFAVTGFDNFTQHDHQETLLGFAVNPLHNIVHILIGALGIALWKTRAGARRFGWILAVVYGLTTIYGFIVGQPDNDANILNINGADNILHLLSTIAGLAIALWPDRDRARR